MKKTSRGGLTSMLTWSGRVAAILAVVLFVVYALTPLLVTRIAPHMAERFGLQTLELEIGYPHWRGIDINQVVVATDQFIIRGEQARAEYTWAGVRAGRAESLNIGTLEILLPSADTQDSVAGPPDVNAFFPGNRVRQINVQQLLVKFPDTGFIGMGHAQMGDGLLALSLDGVAPEMASNFSITADLTRDGQFHLRFGERQDGAPEFLRLSGQIGSDSISLDGSASLSGLPLQLISQLAGLPQGTGIVSGAIQTHLAWPLPDQFKWEDLVATVPEFFIDWQSTRDDLNLKLSAVSGSVQLQSGEVEATVSGALRYSVDGRELTAQLPADYQMQYKQATLSGAAGPRLTIKDATTEATAILHKLSLRNQPVVSLDVDADIDARVDSVHAIGRVRGTLEDDALSVEGALDIKSNPPQPKGEPVGLAKGVGTLKGAIQTRLPSPLPATLVWKDLIATIPSFSIDWQSANNDLQLTGLTGSAELNGGDVSAMVSGKARYRQSGYNVNAQFPKNYRLSFQNNKLTAGKGLRLSLKEEKITAVATLRSFALRTGPRPRLDVEAGIDVNVDTTSSNGQLKVNMTVDDAARGKASGRLYFTGAVQTTDQRHEGNLVSAFSANGDTLSATGTLDSGLFAKVPLALNYNLDTGAGQLQATHVFEFRNSITARLIPGWDAVYDLDAGRIETELKLNWVSVDTIAAKLVAKLTGGRAHYEDYLATGISGILNLRADDSSNWDDWRLEPAVLHVDRVSVGIPVENLMFSVAWSGDEVMIKDSSATLLGGQATATPFVYAISTGSAAFELLLENIDLATVLALEGDDVTGTGKLSGSLPVTIQDDQPRVEAGVLTAAPPGGYVRLTPTLAAPGGQQSLTFALSALKDFTYTELTTNIDYAENGDLVLAVHLKGRNPAVEKGRPIHYNLTITENIPVLLESLRLTGKLNEGIEKKLKK